MRTVEAQNHLFFWHGIMRFMIHTAEPLFDWAERKNQWLKFCLYATALPELAPIYPPKTTKNNDFYIVYYQFTTFQSSDMIWYQQQTVPKEAISTSFGTAFCLSAISSKTRFCGKWTHSFPRCFLSHMIASRGSPYFNEQSAEPWPRSRRAGIKESPVIWNLYSHGYGQRNKIAISYTGSKE